MGSMAEYLKRYTAGPPEEPPKKKKKKKVKEGAPAPKKLLPGIVIHDDDPRWQKEVAKEEDEEEEELKDEAPVVEADMEARALAKLRLKRELGEANKGWEEVDGTTEAATPGPDLSPPRKARHDSPDLSPPRKARHDSPDLSPPRKARHDSPDLSPPRKARHDSPDLPPPRKTRHDSPDLSPPRKRHLSPDAKTAKKARHDSPDLSPPRKGRHDSPDLSPPRKRRHDSPDPSPPRKKQEGEPAKKRRHDSPEDDQSKKPKRMQDGTLAGLRTGKDIMVELEQKRKEDAARFRKMDSAVSGKDANTVYRDKRGRKLAGLQEFMEQQGKAKKPKPEVERPEWGQGLAQKRAAEKEAEEVAREAKKPFARTMDDPDIDQHFRERSRWGDPMAHLVKAPAAAENLARFDTEEHLAQGFVIPQDIPSHSWLKRGVPAPFNRYGIKPGRHWDGVDRSTGFEKELFKHQNAKSAREKEAYLWSVADM